LSIWFGLIDWNHQALVTACCCNRGAGAFELNPLEWLAQLMLVVQALFGETDDFILTERNPPGFGTGRSR
jgi:dUTPase